MSVAQPARADPGLAELGRSFLVWLRKNFVAAIISALVGAAIAFVFNIWLVAVHYQGTNGASAAGHNFLNAGLLSGIGTTVLFGLVGYLRAVGAARFRQDLLNLPTSLATLFTKDGTAGRVHLLWGAAASFLVTLLITPAVGAVLAIGLLASLPGLIGRIISSLVMRIWSQLLQRVAPTRQHRPPPPVAMSVGILGSSAALIAAVLIPGDATIAGLLPARLGLAIGCGLAAYLLGRGPQAGGAATALLMLLGAGLVFAALRPVGALATDGGQLECGSDWARYLTECEGSLPVILMALLATIMAALSAPAGLFAGALAAAGTGPDTGLGDDGQPVTSDQPPDDSGAGGPIPQPKPIPHFPHVFVKGNQLIIEVGNGVILSATLNPDGTLGPWSATNLNTQSGGAIESRITGDDGSVTTYYADGSVVTQNADGTVTSWAPDGSQSVTGADGTVTTIRPDGTEEVRSPDGTVDVTYPDGTEVVQSPDGTVTTTQPDGTEIVTYPDGSALQTNPDGSTLQIAADGTVTQTDADGNVTVRLTDGTTTVTAEDGTVTTQWPDGSSRVENPDGSFIARNADGTMEQRQADGTYIETGLDDSISTTYPDGTRSLMNADGTTTWDPDGTVTTIDPRGVSTVFDPDGSTATTYPNGLTVMNDGEGGITVLGPDGANLGDPNEMLSTLDTQSAYMLDHPDIAAGVDAIRAALAANGGVWTPELLAALGQLQGAADQYGADRTADIKADQAQATADWLAGLKNRDALDTWNHDANAAMTKAQDYILSHLLNLPWDQAQDIRAQVALAMAGGPNTADLQRMQQIMSTTFRLNRLGTTTDAAIAQIDAQIAGLGENAASRIKTTAAVFEGLLMLPFGVASGVAPSLGGFYLGRNAASGLATGFAEHGLNFNGLQYGLLETARNTLPINTAIATGQALVGKASVSDVGWSLIRDMGNMASMQGAGIGVNGIGSGPNAVNFWQRSGGQGLFGTSLFAAKPPAPPTPLWNPEIPSVHATGFSPETPGVPTWTAPDTAAAQYQASLEAALADAPKPPVAQKGPLSIGETPTVGPAPSDLSGGLDDTVRRAATAADDAALAQAQAQAQQSVDEWNALNAKAQANPGDVILQQELATKTAEMMSSNSVKGMLKVPGTVDEVAFNRVLDGIKSQVDAGLVANLNAQGYTRGGQPITSADFWDVRNAASGASIPFDRDLAINQKAMVSLQQQLESALPGSAQAQSLTQQIADVKLQMQPGIIDPVTGQVTPISHDDFRQAAMDAYRASYANVTGQSADQSLNSITDWSHTEAYRDVNAIANRPAVQPLSPTWADQTGSVTSQKMNDLFTKVADGQMTYADALVESARGTAKDIGNKLEPLLVAYNGDPAAIQNARDMQSFLADVGSGKIPPTVAQQMSQNLFGTDIQGLVGRTDAAIATAAKFGPAAIPPDYTIPKTTAGWIKFGVKVSSQTYQPAPQG